MPELPDGGPKLATTLAVASGFVLLASFLVLYLVMSSDALTSNLKDGRYPSTAEAMRTRGGAVLSVVLAVLGYGGLIRAAVIRKTRTMNVLSTLFGAALVGYVPAALFVCLTAFQ
ncbi:hypothetical protein A5792_04280 [Mycolicibacterium peregrinum]|uniref:Uncharacterized protein n=1 Tax=Mycolicibacterium peregrinum TaxID=43304 RepID=A0A1A0QVT9_MYCPR|nr:hypothetical protein [Mycolicibacterium peregrinum]OBB26315.1 hypothetical protein A5792_04280 [Mycolicibacterium peregrinum]